MPSLRFYMAEGLLRATKPPRAPVLETIRAAMGRLAKLPPPRGVTFEATVAGGVPAEWVTPKAPAPRRRLLYLHGGGYVVGSVASHRHFVARLARDGEARALSVDYRLAPEHPYPAAVDDARSAYLWLLEQGAEPRDVAVAGDSAGGGLTLALLMRLRDEGLAMPACACCFSPWVDLAGAGASLRSREEADPILWPDHIDWFARRYIGDADPRTLPYASPLYGDPTGLPPLLVMCGTAEILLDDARRIAAAVEEAGGRCTLDVWEAMFHVFPLFAPLFPEAKEGARKAAAFIASHTPA